MRIPSSDVITVDIAANIATVWLDRPGQRNAFGPEAWRDIPAVMEALATDPEVRVIVIGARGDHFTVGIDLKAYGPAFMTGTAEGQPPPASEADRRRGLYRMIKDMQRTMTSIADCPQPVIAAIHGYCIGAGVDLITACDIRLAAADAVFSVRETRMAMVADVGTLQRLPAIVDPGTVADLVYTGRDVDAVEAHSMGLVSRVLPDADALREAAAELASAIAANSPLAVQGSKAVLRARAGRVDDALDYVALWNAAFLHSNDLAEAVAAFLEKRPPKFTGT
jgi:enoyl-CoA hydratase